MKILFISHTYPPIVGGVETQNYELSNWLSRLADVTVVANRKRWLIPFFLFYAMIKAVFSAKKYDVILLGSCVLGNVGWAVKLFSKIPVVAIAHGLDITWKNKLYQRLWISFFLKKLDKIIAVGNETIRAGVIRGIPRSKFVFIPNGVSIKKHLKNYKKADLEKILKQDLSDKKTILTSGRLAKRKGVAWFIENVMPKLPENVIYIVAGDGVDRNEIEKKILENNLENKVKFLGYVANDIRDTLFNTCDLFVQPNIKIEGDMEGFGISVIEAAYHRLPVIASRLEGLKDAIKNGQNGFLVESRNIEEYIKKINEILGNENYRREFGASARQYVIENYSWDKIAGKYIEEIAKTLSN